MNPLRKRRLRRLALVLLGVLVGGIGIPLMIGCFVFSAPRYHGPVSDHFDGKSFHNRAGDFATRGRRFWKWMASRDKGPWPTRVDSAPGPPPPARLANGDLRVTFVNHSTVLLQMDGLNVLTDPIWSERCSPLSFMGPKRVRIPGIRFEDLPPIDAVLLSHNHYDHLEVATLQRLAREHHPRVFAPLGNKAFLDSKGIPQTADLDWWDSVDLAEGVRLTLVPSQHWSGRGLRDRAGTLWGSYVLTGSAGHIYFAGDTGFGSHFRDVAERFAPFRLAILPIGAFQPRWFMSVAHLSPAEAVEAHKLLRAAHSIPVHYGTFRIADDAYDEPLRDLKQALADSRIPDTEFRLLDTGEGWNVPGS